MLESRRGGGAQGFKDEFVDNAVGGMNHWITAARRGLMSCGFVVRQKPVSMPDNIYLDARYVVFGRLSNVRFVGYVSSLH